MSTGALSIAAPHGALRIEFRRSGTSWSWTFPTKDAYEAARRDFAQVVKSEAAWWMVGDGATTVQMKEVIIVSFRWVIP